MIDTKKFVDRRKELGLSQVKLCKGICTQSTLSKFENNDQIPSVGILSQLCDRLGISIDSLENGKNSPENPTRQIFDDVVQALTTEKYPAALKLLEGANPAQLTNDESRANYYGLRALALAMTNQSWADVLVSSAKVLDQLDEKHEKASSYLAYIALGICLSRKDGTDGACFFYSKVSGELKRYLTHSLRNLSPMEYGLIQLLTLAMAEFSNARHNYQESDQWLSQLVTLCSDRNTTACMPRAKLLAAKNAIAEGRRSWQVRELLQDAIAFARLNHNSTVEVQAAALMKNPVQQAIEKENKA